MEFEWKIPKWSNTLERDGADLFQAYAAAAALYFLEKAMEEVMRAACKHRLSLRCRTKPWAADFTRRCAGCFRITL